MHNYHNNILTTLNDFTNIVAVFIVFAEIRSFLFFSLVVWKVNINLYHCRDHKPGLTCKWRLHVFIGVCALKVFIVEMDFGTVGFPHKKCNLVYRLAASSSSVRGGTFRSIRSISYYMSDIHKRHCIHQKFFFPYFNLVHRTGIHIINYGIRFLTKTWVLLGGDELHAPSHCSSFPISSIIPDLDHFDYCP